MRKGLKKNKKGFTLIELIIVIAILAILAAVAIPNFVGLQSEATRGKDIGNASAIVSAINSWNAVYPTQKVTAKSGANWDALVASNYWPKGMSDTDQTAAIARVNLDATTGVATVSTAAAASSASPST